MKKKIMTDKPKVVKNTDDKALLDKASNKLESRRSLLAMGYGFMIAATVFISFLLITLAWMVPMTTQAKHHLSNNFRISRINCIALGVCCIIFAGIFGIVAGILLIIASNKHVTRKELAIYKQEHPELE